MTSFGSDRVLSFVAVLAVLPALFSCESNDSSLGTVTFRLRTDVPGYGAVILLPAAAQVASPETPPECTMDADADAAGCLHKESVPATGGLRLALRNCDLEDHAALYRCVLPASQLDRIRETATVAIGCGCKNACPEDAGLELCEGEGGDESCETLNATSHGTLKDNAAVEHQSVVTTGPTSVTDATICPTCCEIDFADQFVAMTAETITVSEIRVDIPFDSSTGCQNWDCNTGFYADRYSVVFDDWALHLCVASASNFVAFEHELFDCQGYSLDVQHAKVISASDADLEPMDPLPELQFESLN